MFENSLLLIRIINFGITSYHHQGRWGLVARYSLRGSPRPLK